MGIFIGFRGLPLWLLVLRSAGLERSYTKYATLLRRDLLQGYDPVVPPESIREVTYSGAGTDVRMEIRFFKVSEVSATNGQMRLKCWVRMTWKDLRLAWDPASYGNITETAFDISKESREIWAPDIVPYNSNEPIQASLDAAQTFVWSDGTVFWARPGMVDILCKFSGLVAFPFDRLRCPMEWGAWRWSDGFQGINITGTGYQLLVMEDSSGASYQEYSITAVNVSLNQFFYGDYAQPWTLVKYVVELQRSTFYYGTLIILPTILITYLSFGVFFMSHEVGERLSFGITLLLVVEVMRSSVATFVPICGELLWIDLFMLVSSLFCCLSLLETMIVLYLAFHTDEHLLPNWLAWLAPWIFCGNESDRSASKVVESQAGSVYRRVSKGTVHFRRRLGGSGVLETEEFHSITQNDTSKLIFFENFFYMLDSDANGFIEIEDAAVMLSFVNLTRSRKELEMILTEHFSAHHRLNCADFVEICVELMWTMPFEEIRMGAQNYNSSYMRFTKLCARYWIEWARTVDRWSRFWLPMAFTISLGILFNVELTDDYAGVSRGMFQGFGPSYVSVAGVFRSLIMPGFGVICIVAWLFMRRRVERRKQRRMTEVTPDLFEPEPPEKPIVPRWSVRPGLVVVEGEDDEEEDEEDEEDEEGHPKPWSEKRVELWNRQKTGLKDIIFGFIRTYHIKKKVDGWRVSFVCAMGPGFEDRF